MEEVLKTLANMFTGPLPKRLIATMTSIFGFNDDQADNVNAALLQHAAETLDDLHVDVAASV